jgi:hypothetical protein
MAVLFEPLVQDCGEVSYLQVALNGVRLQCHGGVLC